MKENIANIKQDITKCLKDILNISNTIRPTIDSLYTDEEKEHIKVNDVFWFCFREDTLEKFIPINELKNYIKNNNLQNCWLRIKITNIYQDVYFYSLIDFNSTKEGHFEEGSYMFYNIIPYTIILKDLTKFWKNKRNSNIDFKDVDFNTYDNQIKINII